MYYRFKDSHNIIQNIKQCHTHDVNEDDREKVLKRRGQIPYS